MEEDITILTAFLLSNIPEIITQEEFDEVKQALENLIKGYREQINIIESLNVTIECFRNMLSSEYVHKARIRYMIEELEDKVHLLRPNATKGEMMKEFKVEGAINILYELLEEDYE